MGRLIDELHLFECLEPFGTALKSLAARPAAGIPHRAHLGCGIERIAHADRRRGLGKDRLGLQQPLGNPLGMSGPRLATTALIEPELRGGRYALCTMCIGVGQGIAVLFCERLTRDHSACCSSGTALNRSATRP